MHTSSSKLYSLRKCRHIFKEGVSRYKNLKKDDNPVFFDQYEKLLDDLDSALEAKDRVAATESSQKIEMHFKSGAKKSFFTHIKEFAVALVLAITVAAFVRQVWFELYEIPTGSMRPTFKEHDRVLVSKNAFGINTPFQTSHLQFDPSLIKRGSIVVFTGDKMDIPDVDTTYFMLFPGKKRYVKRCLGKPGDTLYFYGGELYGVDEHGNEIREYLDDPVLSKIEHIPFITFEGKSSHEKKNGFDEYTIKQMNFPVGKITVKPFGDISSQVFNGKEWENNDLSFSKFWGMQNFAIVRIISKDELPDQAKQLGYMKQGAKYYLEIKHSPSLVSSNTLQKSRHSSPLVHTELSWIALSDSNIDALKKALYTSRFYVKGGSAFRFGESKSDKKEAVYLGKDIPDGTYEFFSGTAFDIGILGPVACSEQHPIYPKSGNSIKTLFNSGIEISNLTNTKDKPDLYSDRQPSFFPSRYAYFRDGVLFVMGAPIFAKDDSNLLQLNSCEINRKNNNQNYTPFDDEGAPLKDGHIDKEFIKRFGLKVPEKMYLALGDNHANSLDSRYFGFVPEDNIQGTPLLVFWPLFDRIGVPYQHSIPFLRKGNFYIYFSLLVIGIASFFYYRKKSVRECYHKIKKKRRMLGIVRDAILDNVL